jgi:hypothetical protein
MAAARMAVDSFADGGFLRKIRPERAAAAPLVSSCRRSRYSITTFPRSTFGYFIPNFFIVSMTTDPIT